MKLASPPNVVSWSHSWQILGQLTWVGLCTSIASGCLTRNFPVGKITIPANNSDFRPRFREMSHVQNILVWSWCFSPLIFNTKFQDGWLALEALFCFWYFDQKVTRQSFLYHNRILIVVQAITISLVTWQGTNSIDLCLVGHLSKCGLAGTIRDNFTLLVQKLPESDKGISTQT